MTGWTVTPEVAQHLSAGIGQIQADYAGWQSRNLNLDLQRGKPSPEQLDLSAALLADLPPGGHISEEGFDVRNYGGADGLIELRRIFAELLNVPAAQLLALGNASLRLEYDTIVFALLFGVPGGEGSWLSQMPVKFLCPTPGYDRHFAICESLGIEMIPIPMLPDGPDMSVVTALVSDDPAIKGMWLVPTYANPTGITISEPVARQLFSMPTAAPDFRIFWDDAYGLHHLTDRVAAAHPVLEMAAAGGHPDRLLVFASTSKITFATAGIAFVAASPANLAWLRSRLGVQSIGPDKVNQLRHARYLKTAAGVRELMVKHRELIRPKFTAMDGVLRRRLADTPGIARWVLPEGGYFISLEVLPGTAKRVVELAAGAGLALTPAGSAFPYGTDPLDSHIRLAPTMPSVADVELATEVLATCIHLAAAEKLSGGVAAGTVVSSRSVGSVTDGGESADGQGGVDALLADFGDGIRTVPDSIRVARGGFERGTEPVEVTGLNARLNHRDDS